MEKLVVWKRPSHEGTAKKELGMGIFFVWTDKWFEDETDGCGVRAPWIKTVPLMSI